MYQQQPNPYQQGMNAQYVPQYGQQTPAMGGYQQQPAMGDQNGFGQQQQQQQAPVQQSSAQHVEAVKEIDRSAMFTFAPTAPFMAAGSVAGAIDLSFSTSSQLEIFSLDYSSPGKGLVRVGEAVQAPERFARLSWAATGEEFPHFKYGMLGGGLSDGTVCVWNPASIIDGQGGDVSKTSLLCRLNKHQGAVRGLEFNPLTSKLLASGAADGEVCIWDLGNPGQPSLYPPMKGAASGMQNQVTCLQWNRKVQHILATGTSAGTVVVWDLKKQRPVITLTDSNGRRRCSSIAWNPDIATQVMVASDDDICSTLQLWDLRNAVSPVAELSGHSKGVLSLDWSTHDSSLLLSSGKDNKVVVWDVPSRQPRQEMSSGPNWKFQVQWSNKKQPGVFAGATFEGLISLHSLASCPAAVLPDGQTSQVRKNAPAVWEKKPVAGASFGFGGKLIKIVNSSRQLPTGEQVTTATGEIDQVHMESSVSKLSPEFEQVIKSANRDLLRQLCETRAVESQDPEEVETWKFLQTHFESDSQRELLTRLGFESMIPQQQEEAVQPPPTDVQTAEQTFEHLDLGGQPAVDEQRAAVAQAVMGHPGDDGSSFFAQSPVDGDSFFDQLGSPQPPSAKAPETRAEPEQAPVPEAPTSPKIVDGVPGEAESEILKAMYVGNYKAALDKCLSVKRFSDALIISSMIGGDAWETTRAEVMSAQPRPYMRIARAVLDGDWMGYVVSRPTQSWRETLATLLTSAPSDQFVALVQALGRSLLQGGARHASILCSICAGDVEMAVSLWNEVAGAEASPKARESFLEKAVVLGLGVDKAGSSSALGDLLAKQAEELASAGYLAAAYDLLCLVPGDSSEKANDLRDRLYQGGALDQPSSHDAPAEEQFVSQSWGDTYQQNTSTQNEGAPQQQYGQQQVGYGAPQQMGYGAPPTVGAYKQSPPASPYSTMSSSQPYPSQSVGTSGVAPPPTQPQVFTPAQPAVSAPPSAFGAPPTGIQAAPPSAPPTGPPAGQFGMASSGPASPLSSQASQMYQQQQQPPPTTYGTQQPPPTYGSQQQQSQPPAVGYEQQQQQDYVPSAAPPSVYQPPSSSGYEQQPKTFAGVSQFQPQTAQNAAPAAQPPSPAKPAGPPADIALMTADTSRIPGNLVPIVSSFRSLYQAGEQFATTQPARKRELDDASKKLGSLIWKMNEGNVSESVTSKLLQLAASLDAYDYPGAAHVQVQLTTSDWDECASWLTALKRLIKIRQMSH
ncbi:Protein transport protein SEC31-like protein B [Picochlorum sp. SENEW3]|nr:Protein transport protein SEC31-like protein B [Picochlorum sp. SENEW3]WPT17125.1 Protein transport protein SEC31-like protein B [Picochlorum sp. SENEW3]